MQWGGDADAIAGFREKPSNASYVQASSGSDFLQRPLGTLNVQRMQILESDTSEFQFRLCHLLAVWPWASPTSLGLRGTINASLQALDGQTPQAPGTEESREGEDPSGLWDRGPPAGRLSAVDRGPGRQR